ncbi:class II fumarate hydratase [uncultured Bacteroides sp.]|uniref:class II fumarate hydratase n=1 Tax=uncultured Bacteroides sp. TaxID=162156 RepID=UPI002AA8BF7A|nr:class II fumarate hydratase [uncultured Bacteroides sp.]
MIYRTEKDTMGEVQVPANKYWGAQTQRSLVNFPIGPPASMPIEIIHAFGYLKKAAAITNNKLGILSADKMKIISQVCDEIIAGKLDDQFPLVIWQTGSGTHTNMNCNEVIANRAHVLLGNKLGEGHYLIHPNDDVNKSQSSNDTFPTAMHIAAYCKIVEYTIPKIEMLINTLSEKSLAMKEIVKIGRTHLMDATPLSLGQEFSGYVSQLKHGIKALKNTLPHLSELAMGGSAVGTGLNTPDGYAQEVAETIAQLTKQPFISAENKFESLAANDAIVETHGAIKQLAVSLMKISNDIRLLASGPRSGIGEIIIPSNEPGSSIMPGKVNPTQTEAMTMVCAQIMGNDTTISIAGSSGHFELNTFKPVMINALLHSATLIADACKSFNDRCVIGIEPNMERIKMNLNNSLMLITSLNTHIGYENAAKIAKKAYAENLTLKEAALALGLLTEQQFNEWVVPEEMIGPMK